MYTPITHFSFQDAVQAECVRSVTRSEDSGGQVVSSLTIMWTCPCWMPTEPMNPNPTKYLIFKGLVN